MSQVCCFAAVLDGRNIEAIARVIIIAEQAILGGYKYLRLGVVRLNINSKLVLTLQRRERILHIRNQKKRHALNVGIGKSLKNLRSIALAAHDWT